MTFPGTHPQTDRGTALLVLNVPLDTTWIYFEGEHSGYFWEKAEDFCPLGAVLAVACSL